MLIQSVLLAFTLTASVSMIAFYVARVKKHTIARTAFCYVLSFTPMLLLASHMINDFWNVLASAPMIVVRFLLAC